MIEKQTILVLGAGASCHLGFPLGNKLIEDIYRFVYSSSRGTQRILGVEVDTFAESKLRNSVLLARFLELSGFNDPNYTSQDIEEFANRLFQAQPSSIDFFLEKNPQYSLLGKLCIIFCLSLYEDKDSWQYFPAKFPKRLVNEYPDFGWYQYLWHKMIEGCDSLEDLRKNNVTVITFNYDRSLEYYLIRAIQAFFNVSESEAAEVFNSVKIRHVYGKLGKLDYEISGLVPSYSKTPEDYMMESNNFMPWELSCFFRLMGNIDEYGMSRSDFEQGRSVLTQEAREQLVERFKKAVEQINTFYEANINQAQKKEYTTFFEKAQKIYFLGFGYHELNIQAIDLDTGILPSGIEICGTAIGKSDVETDKIKDYLASFSTFTKQINIRNEWVGMGDSEFSKIRSFFRNISPLE